jgi:hypothetical protein
MLQIEITEHWDRDVVEAGYGRQVVLAYHCSAANDR